MSAAVEIREELTRLLEEARRTEVPPGALCVRLARACEGAGDRAQAGAWLLRVVDAEDAFRPWQAAAARFPRIGNGGAREAGIPDQPLGEEEIAPDEEPTVAPPERPKQN